MGRGFQVWKFHPKISPWEEKLCLPRAYSPWEASFSSRGLIFGGEGISIPETQLIQKSYNYNNYLSTSPVPALGSPSDFQFFHWHCEYYTDGVGFDSSPMSTIYISISRPAPHFAYFHRSNRPGGTF